MDCGSAKCGLKWGEMKCHTWENRTKCVLWVTYGRFLMKKQQLDSSLISPSRGRQEIWTQQSLMWQEVRVPRREHQLLLFPWQQRWVIFALLCGTPALWNDCVCVCPCMSTLYFQALSSKERTLKQIWSVWAEPAGQSSLQPHRRADVCRTTPFTMLTHQYTSSSSNTSSCSPWAQCWLSRGCVSLQRWSRDGMNLGKWCKCWDVFGVLVRVIAKELVARSLAVTATTVHMEKWRRLKWGEMSDTTKIRMIDECLWNRRLTSLGSTWNSVVKCSVTRAKQLGQNLMKTKPENTSDQLSLL